MDYKEEKTLSKQLSHQNSSNFDLESCIGVNTYVDFSKFLLPIDKDTLIFTDASSELRLIVSQFLGLYFNAVTAEMESTAFQLRGLAWDQVLRSHPISPEFRSLGDQFFLEEKKHAELFSTFNLKFCEQSGMDIAELNSLFPTLLGTRFKKYIESNIKDSGMSFWWTIAATEDVAIKVFKMLKKHEEGIDPLFYNIHKVHFEEESKHASYAFMMLEYLHEYQNGMKGIFHKKCDLFMSDIMSCVWLLLGLKKTLNAKHYDHPFFKELGSAIKTIKKRDLIHHAYTFLTKAPYINLYLNRRSHILSNAKAKKLGAKRMWSPKPQLVETFHS